MQTLEKQEHLSIERYGTYAGLSQKMLFKEVLMQLIKMIGKLKEMYFKEILYQDYQRIKNGL